MAESIEKLITRTYDEITKFGDGKMEFETKDVERLTKLAEKFIKLQEEITLHQEDEESDLCTIGELVLNELDMWM